MNFLAHIYLSGDEPDTIWGNFIGDGVKGKQLLSYPKGIRQGIELHRHIDHFTDNHPITAEARKLIRPHFRKYAGVVLDMYFDHFLGQDWERYHHQPLEEFVPEIHDLLNRFEPKMPEKTRRFFFYMKEHNWLLNYRNLDSLSRVFKGMSSRTPFESNMENAVPVLIEHYDELSGFFTEFFPDLEATSRQFGK